LRKGEATLVAGSILKVTLSPFEPPRSGDNISEKLVFDFSLELLLYITSEQLINVV